MLKILRTKKAVGVWRKKIGATAKIGFVPTMGALHLGHLSLIERTKTECDEVIVSIFVNPTQFGPKDDFAKYPRPEKNDLSLLKKMNIDAVFIPTVEEIYTPRSETFVKPRASLTAMMEGVFRPGHFEGVATVVLKLFQIVRPTFAYFGEKDFQQVRIIETMAEDLFLPVKIQRCPTIREKSGLALSSRNAYFSSANKNSATKLFEVLKTAKNADTAISELRSAGFEVEYLEVWEENLESRVKSTKGRWLVAAKFHGVRLIDNLLRN